MRRAFDNLLYTTFRLRPCAAVTETNMLLQMNPLIQAIANVAIYTVIGLVLFGLAFFIMGKATPFSLRKEIEEDQNIALAIVIASVIIGIAMIIVAAITG